MTREEKHLWYDFLKDLPQTIKRQQVVDRVILDFYCHSAKLAIEIDGSQHYTEEGILHDLARDEYLRIRGIRVVHYTNKEIKTKFDWVCSDILRYIHTPQAFPSGEGGTPKA